MLETSEIERIAFITNNVPALQLCEGLNDLQSEIYDNEAEIAKLEAKIKGLEDDVLLLEIECNTKYEKCETSSNKDQSDRLAKLEKMISRTVFNLRENGHMTKKQQLNLADFMAQFSLK